MTRPDTSQTFTTTVACIFAVTRTHANPYYLTIICLILCARLNVAY